MSLELNLREKLRPHADRVAAGRPKDEFDFLPAALHSGLEHAQLVTQALSEQKEVIAAQTAVLERRFADAAAQQSENSSKAVELLKLMGTRIELLERQVSKQVAALTQAQSDQFEILRKRHKILLTLLIGFGVVTLALLAYLALMLKR